MESEFKNYLLTFKRPKLVFTNLYFFWKAFYRKIRNLFFSQNNYSKFKLINRHRKKILKKSYPICQIKSQNFKKSYKLKLVTGFINIKSNSDWHKKYDDIELRVSLDRWNWLIVGQNNHLFPFDFNDGVFLIRSWASQFINDKDLAKNEPYCVGERISNAILFFKLNNYKIPDDILTVLKKLTFQLTQNLEYFKDGLTGNHAFNNSRALYLVSDYLIDDDIRSLALEIAKERLEKLITADGFLREGSSHYQFIFTRWVLEMIWSAESTKDKEAINVLKPYCEKLLKNCWVFLVKDQNNKWSFPLFGDVSPDCTPEWLMSLTWSKIACNIYRPERVPIAPKNVGWANLFGIIDQTKQHYNKLKINFSSNCGWHRLDFYDWTFFTHTPKKANYIKATHAHLDLCSFSLFYKGKPIIIDIGRFDYTNSSISKYGKSVRSHNSLEINNLGPETDLYSWMNPSYSKIKSKLNVNEIENKTIITINHNGFERIINKKINHKRIISLSQKEVKIKDVILGKGKVKVNNFFNFGPDLNLLKKDSKIIKFSNNIDFEINAESKKISRSNQNFSGWMFPSYGTKVPIFSLELRTLKTLPLTLSNKIIINK